MPEGPSIVILKEEVQSFIGKKVTAVSGNTKINKECLLNKKIVDIKSWGKHFLICFNSVTLRVHFMLFGTYRINERKEDRTPRLSLTFAKGEINLYACSIQLIEEDINEVYDWSGDVMSDEWDAIKAKAKIKKQPEQLVCDVLLDQNIFAGVGNIIKNEVLYRTKIHPLSKVGALPVKKLNEMIKEARQYSFDFLEWKKNYVLKQNWLAHRKKTCSRDNNTYEIKHLGKTHRKSYYCNQCQKLYG